MLVNFFYLVSLTVALAVFDECLVRMYGISFLNWIVNWLLAEEYYITGRGGWKRWSQLNGIQWFLLADEVVIALYVDVIRDWIDDENFDNENFDNEKLDNVNLDILNLANVNVANEKVYEDFFDN